MASVPQYLGVSSEDLNSEEPTNDLAIAPENGDEFDACNDETFGDSATFDEDWEQAHEQLASIVSGPPPDVKETINYHLNRFRSNVIVDSEHNESGWTPFSMDGFAFNIKPNMCSNDQNNKLFAPICHGKPGSGDSLLPHPTPQSKLPGGYNGKPVKPMTLDELEKLLLSDNSQDDNANSNNLKPVDKPDDPLKKFFPGVNLVTIDKQEKKISSDPPNNIQFPIISTNEHNKTRPLFYQNPPPLLHGFRPFNEHINRPITGIPRMMIPPFLPLLPGPIRNPSLIQFQQRRFPHERRQFTYRPGGFYPNPGRNEDEYAGLMTQSNKEWLLKVLKGSLNFANPYREDFYYVSFKSKQLAAAAKAEKGDGDFQIPSVIIPERKVDESTIVEYVPVQFEGSLGKIQVANVKCPRKLLDVDFKSKIVDPSQDRPTTPVGRAELNAFRRLLLDIEQLYVVMLEIDEEDKKMGALPEDQRTPHADKRRELCNQLFRGIYDERNNDINRKIASVRKGLSLIVRSLQVLSDPNQKAAILKSLDQLKSP